jgi:hypothetical protein
VLSEHTTRIATERLPSSRSFGHTAGDTDSD